MPYADREDKTANDTKRRQIATETIRLAKTDKRCADCGLPYPAQVLDFDHRDSSSKVRRVSDMPRYRASVKSIEEEIAKCDLVCANCHRMRTFGLTNPHKNGIISIIVKTINRMR